VGYGLRYGFGLKSSPMIHQFDANALAYFSTASITDLSTKIQINDFVKGLKQLGMWTTSSCLLLRQGQNTPSGNTLYVLGGDSGGLTTATLNATTTRPIRNQNGLNFLTGDTTSRVNTQSLFRGQPFNVYAAVHLPAVSGGIIFSGSVFGGSPIICQTNASSQLTLSTGATILTSTATYPASPQKCWVSAKGNGASSAIGINNSVNTGNAGTAQVTPLLIGNNTSSNGANKDVEIAFIMIQQSGSASDIALNTNIYELYRGTIGQGLNL